MPKLERVLPALARVLADRQIFKLRHPEYLCGVIVYLPSRTLVQPLTLALLDLAPNRATFLPRVRVLGESDPLEMFAAFAPEMTSHDLSLELLAKAVAVPPAYSETERTLRLTDMVLKASETLTGKTIAADEPLFDRLSPARGIDVARKIAAFVDEMQADGIGLSALGRLDASRNAGTEQLSLQILRRVLTAWEKSNRTATRISEQERRDRLMRIEAQFIANSHAPVVIAGSTGSIASTVSMMEALITRGNGAIVLPGLDRHLDKESWAAVGQCPDHAQYALYGLLQRLKIDRGVVEDLPHHVLSSHVQRAAFVSEVMRPASTTAKWGGFLEDFHAQRSQPPQLSLIEAQSIQHEAETAALIIRDVLNDAKRTVALVTPDDELVTRVRHVLARYGLPNQREHHPERFALRAVACAVNGKAEDFVALIKHAPKASAETRECAELMDLGALRQIWRPAHFSAIPGALVRAASGEAHHATLASVSADAWGRAQTFCQSWIVALSPFLDGNEGLSKRADVREWLKIHAAVVTNLAELNLCDQAAYHQFLNEIEAGAPPGMPVTLEEYSDLLSVMASGQSEPAQPSPHPRLFFWSPLDARLQTADAVILSGLNEGTWPRTPDPDPWLNRADRAFIGLSPPERRIGQAAHDFVSLASGSSRVFLTRSRMVNGSFAQPSRWITRLKALMAGAGHADALAPSQPWSEWARALRAPARTPPASRPSPRPPLDARPRRLSVTALETLCANPYAVYARYILRLNALRGLHERFDARDKGILIHEALHDFFTGFSDTLPDDTTATLISTLRRNAEFRGFDLDTAPLWKTRFARFAGWFACFERDDRGTVQTLKSEVSGKHSITLPGGAFEITARADRIDTRADGSSRIIDYKTGRGSASNSAKRGAPQLALEGFLAREGAFAGIPTGTIPSLTYIVATGGQPPGEVIEVPGLPAQTIEEAANGIVALLSSFDDAATPYAYSARAIFKDKADYDPYAHLARVKEWGVGATEDGDD